MEKNTHCVSDRVRELYIVIVCIELLGMRIDSSNYWYRIDILGLKMNLLLKELLHKMIWSNFAAIVLLYGLSRSKSDICIDLKRIDIQFKCTTHLERISF